MEINMKNTKKSYIKVIDILSKAPKTRKQLIGAYIDTLGLTKEELADRNTKGKANVQRSLAGALIDNMEQRGMIIKGKDGVYTAADQKPIIIRNEKCENEIIKMLSGRSMSKSAIREELISIFETERTVSERDDNKLLAYMGEALRRMVRDGILTMEGNRYFLATKIAARVDDISSILQLQDAFLSRLHKKGGEFFEVYFMTLLEKYVSMYGKTVTSNITTGGSADGGIDGIMETVDHLGFRETIMVQTKNRSDSTNETDVRGFYGAVCARQGSRGIFATSADFHYAASEFLENIDNCVGVDGKKLFQMARVTGYGIKKVGNELFVDDKVL